MLTNFGLYSILSNRLSTTVPHNASDTFGTGRLSVCRIHAANLVDETSVYQYGPRVLCYLAYLLFARMEKRNRKRELANYLTAPKFNDRNK